jgi:hypothetical protein
LARQQAFREAAAYAKGMKGQAIYIHLPGWFGGKVEYLNLHTDWVNDASSKWFAKDDLD